jgi:hypothetical protein
MPEINVGKAYGYLVKKSMRLKIPPICIAGSASAPPANVSTGSYVHSEIKRTKHRPKKNPQISTESKQAKGSRLFLFRAVLRNHRSHSPASDQPNPSIKI